MSPKKAVTKKTDLPGPLYREPTGEYRTRLVLWLLKGKGPMSIDELVFSLSEAGKLVSTENVRKSVDILHRREMVESIDDPTDRRRKIWSVK